MDRPRTPDTRSFDGDHAAPAPVAALVTGTEEPLRVGDVATVVELAAQLEQAGQRERALREQLHQVHVQLAERDALIEQLAGAPEAEHWREHRRLSAELEAERQARRQDRECADEERDRLAATLTNVQGRLAAVQATRAWRAARTWWRLKERFRVG
jgi:chromosome segregation ATPase